MKKVVFFTSVLVCSLLFFTCKEKTEQLLESSEKVVVEGKTLNLLAVASKEEIKAQKYLYVFAPSGLSLRAFNNLNSQKLGKMPYGSRIEVLEATPQNTMEVEGLQGAMPKINFNHKEGFAFNGYLSPYFPPEKGNNLIPYAAALQKHFPLVKFEEKVEGTLSQPINKEQLTLPNASWQFGFIIAQQLGQIPGEFNMPKQQGKDQEVIEDQKPKKDIWLSQLDILRQNDVLQKITYTYSAQKFESSFTIEKVGDNIVLTHVEKVK